MGRQVSSGGRYLSGLVSRWVAQGPPLPEGVGLFPMLDLVGQVLVTNR